MKTFSLKYFIKGFGIGYKSSPKPLKDITLKRSLFALLSAAITIIFSIIYDSYVWLAPLFMTVLCISYALCIAYQAASGNYVYVEGKIVKIEIGTIQKKQKAVYIEVNGEKAKVSLKKKSKQFEVNDMIYLYLPYVKEYPKDNNISLINNYLELGLLV